MAHDSRDTGPLGRAADTSDVVAEAAVRFFEVDFPQVETKEHLQNLLRQLIHGKRIDLARRQAARPAVPLAEDSAQAPVAANTGDSIIEEMRGLVNELPLTLHRTALVYLEHGNERAAAAALGITRHELRTQLLKIRQIWLNSLGDD